MVSRWPEICGCRVIVFQSLGLLGIMERTCWHRLISMELLLYGREPRQVRIRFCIVQGKRRFQDTFTKLKKNFTFVCLIPSFFSETDWSIFTTCICVFHDSLYQTDKETEWQVFESNRILTTFQCLFMRAWSLRAFVLFVFSLVRISLINNIYVKRVDFSSTFRCSLVG